MKFVPGPFYMGDGIIGWLANINCSLWTLFVCVIFALPTYLPVTGETMNYAAVSPSSTVTLCSISLNSSRLQPITGGVILLSLCVSLHSPSACMAH